MAKALIFAGVLAALCVRAQAGTKDRGQAARAGEPRQVDLHAPERLAEDAVSAPLEVSELSIEPLQIADIQNIAAIEPQAAALKLQGVPGGAVAGDRTGTAPAESARGDLGRSLDLAGAAFDGHFQTYEAVKRAEVDLAIKLAGDGTAAAGLLGINRETVYRLKSPNPDPSADARTRTVPWKQTEKGLIDAALERSNRNAGAAARLLDVDESFLRRLAIEHGLPFTIGRDLSPFSSAEANAPYLQDAEKPLPAFADSRRMEAALAMRLAGNGLDAAALLGIEKVTLYNNFGARGAHFPDDHRTTVAPWVKTEKAIVSAALERSRQDPKRAAELIGLNEPFFKQLATKHGISIQAPAKAARPVLVSAKKPEPVAAAAKAPTEVYADNSHPILDASGSVRTFKDVVARELRLADKRSGSDAAALLEMTKGNLELYRARTAGVGLAPDPRLEDPAAEVRPLERTLVSWLKKALEHFDGDKQLLVGRLGITPNLLGRLMTKLENGFADSEIRTSKLPTFAQFEDEQTRRQILRTYASAGLERVNIKLSAANADRRQDRRLAPATQADVDAALAEKPAAYLEREREFLEKHYLEAGKDIKKAAANLLIPEAKLANKLWQHRIIDKLPRGPKGDEIVAAEAPVVVSLAAAVKSDEPDFSALKTDEPNAPFLDSDEVPTYERAKQIEVALALRLVAANVQAKATGRKGTRKYAGLLLGLSDGTIVKFETAGLPEDLRTKAALWEATEESLLNAALEKAGQDREKARALLGLAPKYFNELLGKHELLGEEEEPAEAVAAPLGERPKPPQAKIVKPLPQRKLPSLPAAQRAFVEAAGPFGLDVADLRRALLWTALVYSDGDLDGAAAMLGVLPKAVEARVEEYGLPDLSGLSLADLETEYQIESRVLRRQILRRRGLDPDDAESLGAEEAAFLHFPTLEQAREGRVLAALAKAKGDVSLAAKALGVSEDVLAALIRR